MSVMDDVCIVYNRKERLIFSWMCLMCFLKVESEIELGGYEFYWGLIFVKDNR